MSAMVSSISKRTHNHSRADVPAANAGKRLLVLAGAPEPCPSQYLAVKDVCVVKGVDM